MALLLMALLGSIAGLYWLPGVLGTAVAAVCLLIALGAATLASGSAIVLVRQMRSERGERDLFLELNKSREPAAIKDSAPIYAGRTRRWFAKRLLGHDLVVGDLVEIKTWSEIRATLDEKGCLEQLPFMPEMLAMCGRQAYVFRCMHRLFDYRKTRRMRHMYGTVLLAGTVCDGSSHGGCEAACHTVWKTAWLKRIDPSEKIAGVLDSSAGAAGSTGLLVSRREAAVLECGTKGPRYVCQLTQLHAASQPIGGRSAVNFIRPLLSGNVTLGAFLVGWLTHLFNALQQLRQGVVFPASEQPVKDDSSSLESPLEAGDQVVVKSSGEIRATLNDRLMHRGLWLEPDMLKHCGRRHRVQAEVRRLIDIVSGEMLTMKTPAYVLHDVHFSGERQIFNAQYEPLFWRSAWLRRDGE